MSARECCLCGARALQLMHVLPADALVCERCIDNMHARLTEHRKRVANGRCAECGAHGGSLRDHYADCSRKKRDT